MPPLDCGDYLVRHLFEIGPVMSGSSGAAPVTHQEITAWQVLTRVPLQPWEARFLRGMSLAYVGELHAAAKHDRKAPWTPEGTNELVVQTAFDLRQTVRAMNAA